MLRPIAFTAIVHVWLFPAFAQQQLAPTPPMGWNSWDSYGLTITESEFKANAGQLAKQLKRFGWQYAVVDEGWYLQNPEAKPGSFRFVYDAQGRYIPATNRFPSATAPKGFAPLADSIHALGLKFGIHIIRGIPREAVAKNLPVAGSSFRASDAADKADTCPWNADNYGVRYNPAGQAYYDSLAHLYAEWGIDYVKVDCISAHPYKPEEIQMISEALRKTGRPIVLSLSPGPAPLDKADELARYAELWRISDDVWDHWGVWPKREWSQGVLGQFKVAASWAPHTRPGHWPDADMLPIGHLGPRPGVGQDRQSGLTAEEQRTMLTLWSIFRSPLVLGNNLTSLDPATLPLLTNDEVIKVNQHSSDARQLSNDGHTCIWASRSDSKGNVFLAIFNLSDTTHTIDYPLQALGLGRVSWQVRDLWARKDLGNTDRFKTALPAHGAALLRLQ